MGRMNFELDLRLHDLHRLGVCEPSKLCNAFQPFESISVSREPEPLNFFCHNCFTGLRRIIPFHVLSAQIPHALCVPTIVGGTRLKSGRAGSRSGR